jgi:hypothetical protein
VAVGSWLVTARERREDRHDVTGLETTLGECITAVDQRDALEIDWDAEGQDDVTNRARLGDVEGCRPLPPTRREKQSQGREESDLDPHR